MINASPAPKTIWVSSEPKTIKSLFSVPTISACIGVERAVGTGDKINTRADNARTEKATYRRDCAMGASYQVYCAIDAPPQNKPPSENNLNFHIYAGQWPAKASKLIN